MKRKIVLIIAILLIFSNIQVYAWGAKGHDIVAYIAEKHLTAKAKKQVKAILGGKSLVYYATWLDNVQNSPYWEAGYKRTKTWHYMNIDSGFTVATMPKLASGDVLTATNMLIDSLTNYRQELNDSVCSDYVRMLIHLIGDLHCPMHIGRKSDIGGNKFNVKWFKQNSSLHKIWDTKLLESVHAWSYSEWQANIDNCKKAEFKRIVSGTPNDWLQETHRLTEQIYNYAQEGENYSYQYMYDYQHAIERQLLAAGYRLARTLNEIFG